VIARFENEYWFLSNFYPVAVEWDGKVYPSTEHAYQAAKTLDEYSRMVIRQAPTPGQAKKLGRNVVLRPDWEQIKFDVMLGLLRQKFASGSHLAEQLLATGTVKLEESNTWGDRIWGTYKGIGQNWLGRLLMQVRAELLESRVHLPDN